MKANDQETDVKSLSSLWLVLSSVLLITMAVPWTGPEGFSHLRLIWFVICST